MGQCSLILEEREDSQSRGSPNIVIQTWLSLRARISTLTENTPSSQYVIMLPFSLAILAIRGKGDAVIDPVGLFVVKCQIHR